MAGDLSDARALLVGTGTHLPSSDLPGIPAVASTVTDLGRALVERCGLAADAVKVLLDPVTPLEMGDAVATLAEASSGPLIVYYVGHGLVSRRGSLYLATGSTDSRPSRVEHTALPYATVRRYLLDSTAGPMVVILDACFSGRAVMGLAGPEDEVAGLAEIGGGFVMTAAGRNELALAPLGERHTAFSGALLDLLEHGDPDGPADLTLHEAYRRLSRVLPARGVPRPRCRSTGWVGELMLSRNPAYRPPRTLSGPQSHPYLETGGPDVCPYKGLAAFEQADSAWFFGRDRLTTQLLTRLAGRYDDPRPLLVTGASGSGKSSLLRAGLLPAIGQGGLDVPGSSGWPRLLFTPTGDPVGALAAQLASLTGETPEQVAARILADAHMLPSLDANAHPLEIPPARVAAGRPGRRSRGPFVLVVDQFEEIFTECDDEARRRAFVKALCRVAEGDGDDAPALVILGVRADFYGRCAEYPELTAALEGNPVVIGAMSTAELRAAVERPAAITGLTLEPGLVELLLTHLGGRQEDSSEEAGLAYEAGRLPLLSHALLATWRQRDGRTLTVSGYLATGGIHGALAVTADDVLAGLDEGEQATARAVFRRLIHVGEGVDDTRRRVGRAQLLSELPEPARAMTVLRAFAADDARLIIVDGDTVEITHEALLGAWPTLRSWMDADRAGLLVEQHLIDAAHAWDRDDRETGALYRGTRLTLARDWAAGQSLGPVARDFLGASTDQEMAERRSARRRARLRVAVTGVLAVLLVVALVATGVVVSLYGTADRERHVATARSLVFEAEVLRESRPATALRLGIAAMAISPDRETNAALVGALSENRYAATLSGHTRQVDAVILLPGSRTALTAGRDGKVIIWDTSKSTYPRRVAEIPGFPGDSQALAVSSDGGSTLVRESEQGVGLWDISDPVRPRRRGTMRIGGPVYVVAVSPDGKHGLIGGGTVAELWDLGARPARRSVLSLGDGEVTAAVFDPQGNILVTGDDQRQAHLWDVSDASRPRRLSTLKSEIKALGDVRSLAIGAGGRLVLVANQYNSAVLWNVSDRGHPRRLATLAGMGRVGNVQSVALTGDGRLAFTGGDDQVVVAWDLARPSAPSRLFTLGEHTAQVSSIAVSSDGSTVLTGSADRTAALWDLRQQTGLPLVSDMPGDPGSVVADAFSPDGRTLVTGNDTGKAAVWDVSDPGSPSRLAVLTRQARGVDAVAFGADGRTVVTGGDDNTAVVWDLSDRGRPRELAVLRPQTGEVDAVALSRDGRMLLTVGDSGWVTLWDLTDRSRPRRLAALPGGGRKADAVAFGPDGRSAVVANGRQWVTIWDLADPLHPRKLSEAAGHSDKAWSVAYSPSGKLLLTGGFDARVLLWDVSDPSRPRVLSELPGHGGFISSVGFAPDGLTVATSSYERKVRIWLISDPLRPRLLVTIPGAGGAVAFSPDGRTIVAAHDKRTAGLWSLDVLRRDVSDPVSSACAIAGRGLTSQEWGQYVTDLPFNPTCS